MTEWEKGQKGYLYDANFDPEILKLRRKCDELCQEYNRVKSSDEKKQHEIMDQILGFHKGTYTITQPFFCDYGINISIGNNFYTNHNCTILDGGKVTIGDNVCIAPNCVISTAGHPIDAIQRGKGLEYAYPITIGNDVWIGANVSILPGVTIGNGVVIGAGSVVNKDIPSNVVAVGNPCRVMREITEKDKEKYPIYKED